MTKSPAPPTEAETRFWSHVDKSGIGQGCWNWKGPKSGIGYGGFNIYGKKFRAHRFSYELVKGNIPEGLELDHLCRNKLCVNPSHLEAVTQRINQLRGNGIWGTNARKTHCVRGHLLAGDNVYYRTQKGKLSGRRCRTCERIREANRKR